MGYEMHFLPADRPLVFLDHPDRYATGRPHNGEFAKAWQGEVKTRRTADGYVLEVGFSVPSVVLEPGKTLGIEIGVCDDDGDGRKSIMMWTGTKGDFWITMDGYGKLRLDGAKGNGRKIGRRRP